MLCVYGWLNQKLNLGGRVKKSVKLWTWSKPQQTPAPSPQKYGPLLRILSELVLYCTVLYCTVLYYITLILHKLSSTNEKSHV